MSAQPASHASFAAAAILCSLVSQNLVAAFAKSLFPVVGVEGVVALRVGFSALILMGIWRPWQSLRLNTIGPALWIYGLAMGLMNLTIYKAFQYVPIGVAVAVEVAGPLFVVLLSSRRAIDWLWIGLAVSGLYLLLPLDHVDEHLDWRGLAYAAAAGLCWALYILFGKRISGILPGGHTVAIGMTLSALVMVPLGGTIAGTAILSPTVLGSGIVIAALSSALPYSLEMMALKHLPRFVFSLLVSMAPAIAALAGFIVLGEALSTPQWLAISCMITASVGSTLTSHHGTTQKPD